LVKSEGKITGILPAEFSVEWLHEDFA